jgi:hypothetical protein
VNHFWCDTCGAWCDPDGPVAERRVKVLEAALKRIVRDWGPGKKGSNFCDPHDVAKAALAAATPGRRA